MIHKQYCKKLTFQIFNSFVDCAVLFWQGACSSAAFDERNFSYFLKLKNIGNNVKMALLPKDVAINSTKHFFGSVLTFRGLSTF